jgi:hypothetical protein
MAGQFPNPVSEWSDKEYEIFAFGPFAAANTGTYVYYKLPIEFTRDAVIHDVRIKVATTGTTTGVVSSAVSTLYLAKGLIDATTKVVTKPAEGSGIPTNQQVCTGRLLNATGIPTTERMEWLPVQKGYGTSAATTFNSQVSRGDPNKLAITGKAQVWDNIIEKGNNLYMTTDVAATALVGLWIQIRVGERKN